MKRIKDNQTLDEPLLIAESQYSSLWVTDIVFDYSDDYEVVGSVNLVQEDYRNTQDEFDEPESEVWQQGFTFDVALVQSLLNTKHRGDIPLELIDTINQSVRYDGGTQFSKQAKQKLNKFIVESYIGQDFDFYYKNVSDSRKVSDGLEEGASPTFFFDCDLNLDWSANYGGSRYYTPEYDLDYESYHDEKGKELPDVGFYTYEECYDAALKRAMDFYYEGVEKFADNPDIDVTGVHVQIIKLDENGDDFGDYEDFFNIYPTEDNAETGKFIIN